MAEEIGKSGGWRIFDRLKNLLHVVTEKGDLKRTPCKTSMHTKMNKEDLDIQEILLPHKQQGDQLTNFLSVKYNESSRREEFANTTDDGVLNARGLLDVLHAIAMGIRDFEVVMAKPKEQIRSKKKKYDKSTKSKTKKSFQKKLLGPKKVISKGKEVITLQEIQERPKLPFSDNYLKKAYKASISTKPSKKATNNSSIKKPLKPKTSTAQQPMPPSSGDTPKLAKKEVRSKELESHLEEKIISKKKISVLAKKEVNQRIRALSLKKRLLPEAAVAEVVAAKIQQKAAKTEMMKLLDEIRDMKNDNYNYLSTAVTERWIGAHADQLRYSFDFYYTVLRHALVSLTSKVEA